MEFIYRTEGDVVTVWLQDEKTGKNVSSIQLPRKDVDYVKKRAMRELDFPEDSALNLAVYVVYLRVTWGL